MIKMYLDWNVMTQMKNGKHPDLLRILKDDERFFIPYSTSHIGDLFANFKDTPAQQEYIRQDIEFIAELTANKCLYNDGSHIRMDFYEPGVIPAKGGRKRNIQRHQPCCFNKICGIVFGSKGTSGTISTGAQPGAARSHLQITF